MTNPSDHLLSHAGKTALICSAQGVAEFFRRIQDSPWLAVDTETTGLDPHTDKTLTIQVGTADIQGVFDAEPIGVQVLEALARIDKLIVFHHAKFDLKMFMALAPASIDLGNLFIADTMLAEQLLTNGRQESTRSGGFALAELADRYLRESVDKSARSRIVRASRAADLLPDDLAYARRDVEVTYRIFEAQLPRLKREGLLRALAIESAAALAFAQMEWVGMPIDVKAWTALTNEADAKREAAKHLLDPYFRDVTSRDLFGATDLNYESEKDVLHALQALGIRVSSTRREVLEGVAHPVARALLEYREHHKIASTYGKHFLAHVHPKTGRIHSNYRAIGATTGRVASSDPNLQNIPTDSAFRRCFLAPPARKLITADYAAAELRILAEVSRDPVFLRTFREGGDLHAIVAAAIFKVPVSKTEHAELRARAKAINFGLVYGMGAQGLATQIGSSLEDAERLLHSYFASFPLVKRYLEESASLAIRRGFAASASGRRLWLSDLRHDGADEGSIVRIAKNMPIQGTNADMTKLAIARLVRAFRARSLDARLINMVHDEVVVEASTSDADEACAITVREMIQAGREFVKLVPIEVDAKVSDAWEK